MKVPACNRMNQYRILWVFVFFDLPTETKKHRREYTRFRKSLLKNGFIMMQYSIYMRHTSSSESADVHLKRIRSALPAYGEVILFTLTDKQFGMMEYFRNHLPKKGPDTPQQLELF